MISKACTNNLIRKILFFWIFLIFTSLQLFSQPAQTQKFLPVFSSASPEASGFTRYGDYQVNLFTGTPEISIPVYEIKVGNLTVPISLTYHASGIRVNEIASRVGLGWDLQAGGAVTRKIMGKADDLPGNYLSATSTSDNRVKSGSEINTLTQAGLDYLTNVDLGFYDVEPDLFSFSFPGHSGKFLFNQKNNFSPILIPYAPIDVQYAMTASSMRLSLTDESGINYKFDSTEWASTSSTTNTMATSAWLLSDMISENKQDSIHFRYTRRSGGGITDSYFSDYIVLTDNCVGNAYTPDFGIPYSDMGSANTLWQQLNQIDFKNGKVVFESATEAREDFSSQYQLQHRINTIKIYSFDALGNSFKLMRILQFYQSYFINGTDAGTKRLRLDSLQIKNSNGTTVQSYQFNYNNTIQLPNNLSRMKDYWGYFNNVDNRRADGYATGVPRMQVSYLSANNPPSTIWIGGDHTNARDPDPNYMQAYMLQKITFPTGGNTQFEYETNKYLDDQNVSQYAGGLRIKSIKSYISSTADPIVKTYKYGAGETGYGRKNFFLENHFFVSTQYNRTDAYENGICPPQTSTKNVRTFFANPTNELEGYDGPVVYPEVSEYTGDGTVNSGKTIYKFSDRPDARTDIIGYGKPIFDSYHFARGSLINKSDYRRNGDNTYSIVAESKKGYRYFPIQFSSGGIGLVVYKTLISNNVLQSYLSYGNCNPWTDSYNNIYNNYDCPSGDNKLVADTSIVYDQNDPSKYTATITYYSYDDITHLQLTQTQSVNSKNETVVSTYTHPYNYSSAPYTYMTTNHVFDKIIQETKTNNSVQISKQINNYGDFGNYNYLPQNIQLQNGSNTIETRASFVSYDAMAHPLEMQKSNDIKQSYIWDYKNIYPIAEVTNAAAADIAYTSFEAEGKGNWNFTGLQFSDGSAPTGSKAYNLATGNISKWGLNSSGTYYVSYWSKNGGQTVSGTVATSTGRTLNGWTQFEHKVVNPGAGMITISGSGIIDELRLYPSGAIMTTATFQPLVGITSACNAMNQINYYYYDEFNRLALIRDQDKNIVKKICYNYYAQTENCNFYFNTAQSGSFTNSCSTGYTGSSVTYTVPAETYSSTMSQADADSKASADVAANGQSYANAVGTCTYNPPMIALSGYNNYSSNYNLRLTNNTTGSNYYFILNANTFSIYSLGQVPSGVYTVLFYPSGMPVNSTFDINGYTYYGTGATFYNISITSSSTARMY